MRPDSKLGRERSRPLFLPCEPGVKRSPEDFFFLSCESCHLSPTNLLISLRLSFLSLEEWCQKKGEKGGNEERGVRKADSGTELRCTALAVGARVGGKGAPWTSGIVTHSPPFTHSPTNSHAAPLEVSDPAMALGVITWKGDGCSSPHL